MVLCLCELWIWILYVDGRSRYLYIVLGGYLRTMCSIMLHPIDIRFQPCICLWQISKIHNYLCVVVGPGFVSTSPAFLRSSANHPVGSEPSTHWWSRNISIPFLQCNIFYSSMYNYLTLFGRNCVLIVRHIGSATTIHNYIKLYLTIAFYIHLF